MGGQKGGGEMAKRGGGKNGGKIMGGNGGKNGGGEMGGAKIGGGGDLTPARADLGPLFLLGGGGCNCPPGGLCSLWGSNCPPRGYLWVVGG